MTIENRITQLEQRLEQRRQRNDPHKAILLNLQLAQMDAMMPAGVDGSPERQAQLDRVARLQEAYDTGDTSGLLSNDLETLPPAHAGTHFS